MRKVFVDGGARIGETLYMLLGKRPDLLGCDVYFFECNENHIPTLQKIVDSNKDYNFILKQNAIWNKDETKLFYITNDQWGDLGCTLKSEKREKMDRENPLLVECINFSNFINEFDDDTYLVVKLDIEGAEYEVLENLIESGMINKINELYVEFHDHFFEYGLSNSLKDRLLQYKNLECHFDWE